MTGKDDSGPADPTAPELDRIRGAYARRQRESLGDRYALHRPGPLSIRAQQLQQVARALRSEGVLPFSDRRILEVGCGDGQWLVDFETMGARRDRLAGIDLDPGRIARARQRLGAAATEDGFAPGAELREGSAHALPWPDGHFDIVFQSTVFTSIKDAALRTSIAQEMDRVCAREGLVVWYDFFYDNPFNRDVVGLGRQDIAALFPGWIPEVRRVTLAPPLARRLSGRFAEVASLLERTGLLNTHYLATLRRHRPHRRSRRGRWFT